MCLSAVDNLALLRCFTDTNNNAQLSVATIFDAEHDDDDRDDNAVEFVPKITILSITRAERPTK